MTDYVVSTLFTTTPSGDGTIDVADLSDASAVGRALLTAATVADQRLLLGVFDDIEQTFGAALPATLRPGATHVYATGEVDLIASNGTITVAIQLV